MHARTRGDRKKKADGKQEKMVETSLQQRWKQPHLMATAIQQTVYSLSLSLAQPLALVRSLQTKIWWGGSRGTGVESGVGGGVGLLKRVIFFFQRGERRTVMCAELMTKGPFMCSVCR